MLQPVADAPKRTGTLALMVVLALAVRLIVMGFLYKEQIDPFRDHFRFGYETGRIARSVASGQGFGNPLFANTGPTAWMTPVYPLIIAGIFKIFGIYTKASALAALSFNALTSAFTCLPVFFFARKSFGDRVGLWSGWTWAFFPYAIYFPMERIWETWLATLLFCLVFLIGLYLEDSDRLWSWLGFGTLWGVAALTSPALLSVLPFLGIWICYRLHQNRKRWLTPVAIGTIAFIAVVSPWFIRNLITFHKFIPFRDGMGLVLRLGTKGSTMYWGPYELGPWHNDAEWKEYIQLGEVGYMEHKKEQAVEAIKAQPIWYIKTSFRRMVYLWTGYWSLDPAYLDMEPWDVWNIFFCSTFTLLALTGLWRAYRRDPATAIPYAIVLLTFPFIYYFTSPEAYYRRPIDPMMVALGVNALLGSVLTEPDGIRVKINR